MRAELLKIERRVRRKAGLRKRVSGTADKPRLTVFRSNKHIYAQLIDDARGVTLCEASTRTKGIREAVAYGGNKAAAKAVGAALAERAKAKNIAEACMDRNGYRFHGRVRALAEAVRENGLKV